MSFATKECVEACDYVGIVSQNKVPDKLEMCGFTAAEMKEAEQEYEAFKQKN